MPPRSATLPAVEVERLFAILRFISKQQFAGVDGDASSHHDAETLAPPLAAEEGTRSTNSLVIPAGLEGPLAEFRMAVTNLPLQMDAIESARERICTALQEAYPSCRIEVSKLCSCVTPVNHAGSPCVPGFMSGSMYRMESMQEIVPGLYLGSYHPAADKENLTRHHITHVLCCIDVPPRFPKDFVYMRLPAQDTPEYFIGKFFPRVFDFIEDALIKKHSAVLVHCGAGISRAPTIVASYLMRKMGLTADAAIALIKQKRCVASPNSGFRRQLQNYQKELGI